MTTSISTAASVGHGFVFSENRELTIEPGGTDGTGMVTITALDDDVDGPNETVEVVGTVTDGHATPPTPRMRKIMNDDGAPTVMLVLTPTRVQENGGESVVTAALSGPLSEPVIVPVSASAVSPAVAADFELSADRTLTIDGNRRGDGSWWADRPARGEADDHRRKTPRRRP